MGATERVVEYIDYKGITKYKFCKDLGFSNKFLDNSSNMGTDKARKILHQFPDINPTWLLTGEGNMIKSSFINENEGLIDKKSIDTKELVNKRFVIAIKTLIEENPKIKKSQISKNLSIGNSTLSEILKHRMNVGVEVLAKLSTHYKFSLEWLINGIGGMKKEEDHVKPAAVVSHTPQVITIDKYNEDNIVMVAESAAAGYLSGFGDPEYIGKLPAYSLPNLRNGIFRMFQVAGFSMLPTLHHHSIVVGQFVENWQCDIKDNRVYVLVTKNNGIVVKRCLNRLKKYGNLYCKSDNRSEFPSFRLEEKDISEIWEVKTALIHDLADPADLHDKVNNLEAEILTIKSALNMDQNYLKVAESQGEYRSTKHN